MFWVARRPSDAPDAEASEQRSDEDNDGGGGGPRRPKPPSRGPSPDGMPLDWDAFDREREAWEPAPSAPREREPALA